jgi:threonine/homoserine/homoserine lactone efflux protein
MPYISIETLSAFALTSLVIELTPGPNMAYLAVLSLGHGRRAGLAATLGIALGLLIVGVAAALGLAALISSSILLYEALRWTGFAYLLWLAWLGWQGDAETSPGRPQIEEATTAFFKRGLITNLLNPKAAIFYVAVVPSFVEPGSRVLGQTVTLSTVYVCIATAIHVMITMLAGSARPFLVDRDRTRFVRRLLSVGLAAIAVWFTVSTARVVA